LDTLLVLLCKLYILSDFVETEEKQKQIRNIVKCSDDCVEYSGLLSIGALSVVYVLGEKRNSMSRRTEAPTPRTLIERAKIREPGIQPWNKTIQIHKNSPVSHKLCKLQHPCR
jgi:hypothetical protein